MRIWSLHPEYLDSKGLVALWRETLLAKNVLQGNTIGYRNHPQLNRFKLTNNPLTYINSYLSFIYDEAMSRGYNFNKNKFEEQDFSDKLTVTDKQIKYEFEHLLKKLEGRDIIKFNKIKNAKEIKPHPIFRIIEGDIEGWEII